MELTQFVIPLFVALEVALILLLYRYVLRDWIIAKWEEKMDEEGWLILKDLDPMNNLRKAAKDNDWTSLMVEYAANKAGLGALLGQNSQKVPQKQPQQSTKLGLK